MRKLLVCFAVAATAALVPWVAGAQARQSHHAKKAKHEFVVIHRQHAHVQLFVQRSHRRSSVHVASCMPGSKGGSYCTPPVQQNLFGAYMTGGGSATFGSNSSSTCKSLGYASAPCGVYAPSSTLIVAFVGDAGPWGTATSITVSCTTASGGKCPVTFTKVSNSSYNSSANGVWYADVSSAISQTSPIFVTATGSGCSNKCEVSLQAITFANAFVVGNSATGIGSVSSCTNSSGAPTCSLKTSQPDSLVWAGVTLPTAAAVPTWPSNQFAVGLGDFANQKTFYSQFLGTCTSTKTKPCTPTNVSGNPFLYVNPFVLAPTVVTNSGTTVTINDTAPKTAYMMSAVEIT